MANFIIFMQVKNPPAQAEESPDKLIVRRRLCRRRDLARPRGARRAGCLINVEQGIERAKE